MFVILTGKLSLKMKTNIRITFKKKMQKAEKNQV